MSAHVLSRLSAFLDRELTEAEAGEVRLHLADCADCAARLRELEDADGAFAAMPAEAPPGYFDSFAARVRTRIEAAPAARGDGVAGPGRFRLPVWSWAVAAALLLGVLLPRLPWDGGRPRTRAERAAPAASIPARPAPTPAPTLAADSSAPRPSERAEAADAQAGLRVKPGGAGFAAADARRSAATRQDAASPEGFVGAPLEDRAARPAAEARLDHPATPPDLMGAAAVAPAAPGTLAPAAPLARPTPRALAEATARKEAEETRAGGLSKDAASADEQAALRRRDEAVFAAAPAERPALAAALEQEEADAASAAPVPGSVEAGAGKPNREPKARGQGARAAVAEPGRAGATPGAPAPVEAEFDALKAREAGSLDELRRVREEWRSFLSRHPQGPRADEARVEMIAVSVEIAVRTRAVADEAEARGQARAYLARSGAAQKERVRALVARLGGNP